jgi:hypothetical protein
MRASTVALSLALLVTTGHAADQTSSQPPHCFEVIAANPKGPPGAPILVNRCSGETYLLTRMRRNGQKSATFQWVPIDKAISGAAGEPPLQGATSKAIKPTPNGCFVYNQRIFCP